MSTKNEKIKLDTYFGIEWESFKSIVKQCGFKVAYKKEFVNRKLRLKVGSTPSTEEEIIYFNENGIILYSYSNDNCIGRADCYLEVKPKERGLTEEEFNVLRSCAAFFCNNLVDPIGVVPVQMNVKEEQQKYIDCERINMEKIETCVHEVKKIIFG